MKHRLLPKPFFFTFDAEGEARTYGQQLEALLARGIVPEEMLTTPSSSHDELLSAVILQYCNRDHPTESDKELLGVVARDLKVKGLRMSQLTYQWVDGYVAWLKEPAQNYTPGTIRKRVGSLARVVDWHIRSTTKKGEQPIANVLRLLPRGYSVYAQGAEHARQDVMRDRRLSADELTSVRSALAGTKRPDRQRAFITDPADQLPLLFELIINTGMRLFEAYRLRVESIDFVRNVINVEGSKGHRGVIKPRVVPMVREIRKPLQEACVGRSGLVFGFWDGSVEDRKNAQLRLTSRFKGLFDYAGVADMSERDLRHEAACRWFTMRGDVGWVFSDLEICRIMGWTDPKLALRYLSLRGEDLSSRLG